MVRLEPFKSDRYELYHNQDQRDVHIWGPATQEGAPALRNEEIPRQLIGGFYNHNNRVTYATLYKWLDLLIGPPKHAQARKDPKERLTFGLARFEDILDSDVNKQAHPDSSDQGRVRRLAEPTDPRAEAGLFPPPNVPNDVVEDRLITNWIPRNDNNPCTKGHYLVFYGYFLSEENDGEVPETLIEPIVGEVPMVGESIFDTVKLGGQGNNRKASFRTAIQQRDKEGCIITGTKPMERGRGVDYTGLEAAHLFPVAWVGKANAYLSRHKRLVHLLVKNEGVNRAQNGILLRVDIHRLFDQYVWSIFEDKLYFFEEARPGAMGNSSGCLEKTFPQFIFPPGCAGLNDIRGVDNDGPYAPSGVAQEPPEPALMRFHFECALHKNIVDCGPALKK